MVKLISDNGQIGNQMQYFRVKKTPFIPFYLPDGHITSVRDMEALLLGSSPLPLVILLTHRRFDIPNKQQYQLDFRNIRISSTHIPDGPAFSEFKKLVFDYLKLYPKGMIGVSAEKRNDLCGYFIVRWLLEEKMVEIPDALSYFKNSAPEGITDPHYLKSIQEIYEDDPSLSAASANLYDSPPPLPDSPIEDSSLIKVTVHDERLKHVNRNIIINNSDDPILNAVGMAVQPQDAGTILSDLRLLLSISERDFFVAPYFGFNSATARQIKDDYGSLYMVMPEPQGKRCLLYIRGPNRYLVGEDFLRQVNLYLPETEKGNQTLSSGIFEGTLAKEGDDSIKTMLFISDVHMFNGDDLRRKPFDLRMGVIFNKVIFFRQAQQSRKLNLDKFEQDDINVDLRKYLRLKYMDLIFNNPAKYMNIPVYGLVFSSKSPPKKSQISFMWKVDSQEDITVRVRVKSDKYAEGTVNTMTEDEIPIVKLSPVTPMLKQLNGKLIDIGLSDFENQKWEVKGVSDHSHTTRRERFADLMSRPTLIQYGAEDLKRDVHQIIQMAVYVEEDRSKQQKRIH
ncbi:hypothetical protein TRFO_30168 [Tritrichomonas foetus]|uniref:Uncharacterized protein n=1 Tax=Tritrichomonas foetus TaxID=1144522 RepID=A0A1J4JU46_9EUKA|nr:hypothetical protein TRFO_30168 [Tritrichomonas foetus]|eukprot:OHT02671.1 hypothetical protein TRFO_30168 [Tritrichomonas foetus]